MEAVSGSPKQENNQSKAVAFAYWLGKNWKFILMWLLATLAVSIVDPVSFALVFPSLGLILPILIGLSALYVEGRVFWHDVKAAYEAILEKGIRTYFFGTHIERQLKLSYKKGLEEAYIDKPEKVSKEEIEKQANAWLKEVVANKGTEENKQLIQDAFREINPQKIKYKSWVAHVCVVFVAGNGLGFGAMTFMAIMTVLGTSLPLWVPPLVAVFGMAAGVTWALLMFKNILDAIDEVDFDRGDNLFKKALMLVGIFRPLKALYSPSKTWHEQSASERVRFSIKSSLKTLGLVFIIGIFTLMTLGMTSAFVGASVYALSMLVAAPLALSTLTMAVTVFLDVTVIPVMGLFGMRNGLAALSAISTKLNNIIRTVTNPKDTFSDLKGKYGQDPEELAYDIGYTMGDIVDKGALILHITGRGAVSGVGGGSTGGQFSRLFKGASTVVSNATGANVSSGTVLTVAGAVGEGTNDSSVMGHDHSGGLAALGGKFTRYVYGRLFHPHVVHEGEGKGSGDGCSLTNAVSS